MTTAMATRTRSLDRPHWLPKRVWPFETIAVTTGGREIAVSTTGRGPALLFYTGIGSFIWRDVMLRLSNDFWCMTLDPPGIGLAAPVPRSATTLQASSNAVRAVIDVLDLDRLTLVVHDTGGPPAIAAALDPPMRVRGLVAVNSFGWRPRGAAFRGMLALMGSGAMRSLDLATNFLPRLTSTAFGIGRHLDDESKAAFRAGLIQTRGAFHDYLRDALDSPVYDDVAQALEGPLSTVPLMTIFGERNDPLGFQPQWKALFPAARQVVVSKGNHFPMCDDPDLVAAAIRQWHRDFVA